MRAGEDEMFDNIARAAQARRAKTEADIKMVESFESLKI